MPFNLHLPFFVCYPLTLVARKLRPQTASKNQDQSTYFNHQYSDTKSRYCKFMGGLDLKGKRVLDIGCGLGGRALGWLDLGASRVINIEINCQELKAGQDILKKEYPSRVSQVEFRHPDDMDGVVGDVAILFDCFEHLTDPLTVLNQIFEWLPNGGLVWIGSMGWYNYMASHCTGTIPIPWCQCLFSEQAIIKTFRKLLHSPSYKPGIWDQIEGLDRWDKVSTLKERPGEPLNMLSLRQIHRILKDSPFKVRSFDIHEFSGNTNKLASLIAPLAKLPILQELFHSYYTMLLEKLTPIPSGPPVDHGRPWLAEKPVITSLPIIRG